MANYQTVGDYEHGLVVELKPNAHYRVVDAATGQVHPDDVLSRELVNDAISYYQVVSEAYQRGDLKLRH